MKENILYAYHINPSDLKDYPHFSTFTYNDKTYYFSLVKRDEKNFKILLEVMQELQRRKSNIFPFIISLIIKKSFLLRLKWNLCIKIIGKIFGVAKWII